VPRASALRGPGKLAVSDKVNVIVAAPAVPKFKPLGL